MYVWYRQSIVLKIKIFGMVSFEEYTITYNLMLIIYVNELIQY